jgi:hypothetical protein
MPPLKARRPKKPKTPIARDHWNFGFVWAEPLHRTNARNHYCETAVGLNTAKALGLEFEHVQLLSINMLDKPTILSA